MDDDGLAAKMGEIEALALAEIETFLSTENSPHELKDSEIRINTLFSKYRSLIRDLETLVDELEDETGVEQGIALLSNQKRQYESMQMRLRQAAAQRKERKRHIILKSRDELLGPGDGAAKRRQLASEADVLAASTGVTESLKRTKNLLAQELEHSGAQLAAMEMSQERLKKTRSEYAGQHLLLKTSKNLLKVIDWQNKSERYLLWAGLVMFCLVALYITQKRAMYFVPEALRPMRLLRKSISLIHSRSHQNMTNDTLSDADSIDEL
eukprot:jgi/Picsp_1/109/NSC_00109-R1_vesicle transport protein